MTGSERNDTPTQASLRRLHQRVCAWRTTHSSSATD